MTVNLKKLKKPTAGKGKGKPPTVVETKQNLKKPASGRNVSLLLKIPPELRREYRVYAAERDIELNKLFEQVWGYFKESHG